MAIGEITRRRFVRNTGCAASALALTARLGRAAGSGPSLAAGEGTADITPPLGIEMAGFHRPPGKQRRITGIRQPAAARAILIQTGDTRAVIVSLDICGISSEMATRVQREISEKLAVPIQNIHICATHTHSMPTLRYFRQWGAVSDEYRAVVEKQAVRAAELARADLAPAELCVGKSRAEGANFNRTTKTWKTDLQFTDASTDADRWLDTMVRVLHFRRGKSSRGDLLWYHFSAHPVCYTDDNAGPDWPGLVARQLRQKQGLWPSLLQGHIGDVNPGSGKPWLGIAEDVATRVVAAIDRAIDGAVAIGTDPLRILHRKVSLPLDTQRLRGWLGEYGDDPAKCTQGPWVDARFAEDWFKSASRWDLARADLPVPVTAMRLGEVGLLLHPAELYSFYGLAIQRESPLSDTLVVGYADDIIGYLPDPEAYRRNEYSAIVVPTIIDLPPFTPTAARQLTAAAVEMLKQVTG